MPIDTRKALLKKRRTKIVATLGPSSLSRETIGTLIDAGVDMFRLNMSHGDHDTHRGVFEIVRAESSRRGQHVAVLGDLSGPKIRCGRFRGGSIELDAGSEVVVTVRDVEGEPGLIPSQYESLANDVGEGDQILLDDGNFELRVTGVDGTEIRCQVIHGGTLKDRKGINLPGVHVSAPSLTPKDRRDAVFALALGVDYLALSFVRRASDVEDLKQLIAGEGHSTPVISKIEKPEALDEIDAILDASDGIMVARGDLGVELPPEIVPIIQGQLVHRARMCAKPVIVATQMLESMIENARPTRAEVSDIANAVMSGTDAVMLSAETASGRHPIRAVEVMNRVARESEAFLWRRGAFGSIVEDDVAGASGTNLSLSNAIARATAQLSRDLQVRAIFVVSSAGTTGRMMSSARPAAPMLAASHEIASCRRMNLFWGVVPVHVDEGDLQDPNQLARRIVREAGLAEEGQYVLRVSGFHQDRELSIPTIAVLAV